MTTRVTVDAHAGWDVEVEIYYLRADYQEQRKEVVPKNTTKDFFIHSGMWLGKVVELNQEG